MADRQAKVEVSVEGADKAGAAARSALSPWVEWTNKTQGAFGSLRSSAGQAIGSVIQDLGKVVTVGSSISFAGAVSQVQSLEKATSILSVAAQKDWGAIKAKINGVSEATGKSAEEIANFVLSVGKATGNDFGGAMKNVDAFRKFALETGRELTEQGGLAAALKRAGVSDAGAAIDQLRAKVAGLNTVGGPAALADQFVKVSGAIMGTNTSAEKTIATLRQLGSGLGPAQAEAVQASVYGFFSGNKGQMRAHLKRTTGIDVINQKTGEYDMDKAMELERDEVLKMPRQKQMNIVSGWFGGNSVAAARWLNMKKGAGGGAAGESDALNRWKATPGGQAESDDAAKNRNLAADVGHDSMLGGMRESFRKFASNNPIMGALAEFGIGATLGGAGKAMSGSSSGESTGSVLKTLIGLKAGQKVLSKVGLRRLGGLAGPVGEAALATYETVNSAVEQQQSWANLRSIAQQGSDVNSLGQARAVISAAERSGGTPQGFVKQLGPSLLARAGYKESGAVDDKLASVADPVLKSLIDQIGSGSPELKGLPVAIAQEVAKALKGSPLQINVITNAPVEVDQPGGDQ